MGRPEVRRPAERDNRPIRGDEPVAISFGARFYRDNGTAQVPRGCRSHEAGIAEREDAAVTSHQPIAVAIGRRGNSHHRSPEVQRPEVQRPEARRMD